MPFKRFNLLVVSVLLAATALCAWVNRRLNVYGLYGDARGLSRCVLGTERSAKYLFSFNYIPANFDGLLIGSSISDNWDTSRLGCGRIYNGSINGGNISEGTLIAGNVLRRRSLRTFLILIYPYLTESFGRKSGYMTPQEYWAGLGSIQLFDTYLAQWRVRRGWGRPDSGPFGEETYDIPPMRQVLGAAHGPTLVDEQALAQYVDLLAQARRNGGRIVGIVPLVQARPGEEAFRELDRYVARLRTYFLPGEQIIDLNRCPELAAVKADDTSFPDGIHYSKAAALRIVEVLDRRLHE